MWEYAVILFILVVVGFLILQPLLRPRAMEGLSSQRKESREKILLQSKENVYAAIKEMDFDFGMGKISEADYRELRSQYKSKAIEILKELETIDRGDPIDIAIEREVRNLRERKDQEAEIKNEKQTVSQINFCPQCGNKVASNDNFCQRCGTMLSVTKGRG